MQFRWKKYCLLLFTLFIFNCGNAQVFDMVVDAAGSADYTTIQEAISSVPDNNPERTLIFVKNGIYYEKVLVSATKINVSLIGQSADGVILTYDDNPQNGTAPADTYTLHADADGFYAENITVENTSGKVGQAIAIRTTGDTMAFKNCRFIGFQDTYYAHKRRQYNLKCFVQGGTDFIYGDATTVFDSCTINCVNGGSYISAPADTKLVTNIAGKYFLHGLLFRYCDVTADENVQANSYYLGRPWQPNSSSVYIECKLGTHIKPEGWSTWSDDNHLSSVFAEYKDMNADGTLADVSQRVDWSYQLDSATVANLYKLDFFLRKSGVIWKPEKMTNALPAPKNVIINNNTLSWNEIENARGYVILKENEVLGFSFVNSFSNENISGETADYVIKSVSSNGNLSENTANLPTSVKRLVNDINVPEIKYSYGIISFSEEVDYQVYTLGGQIILAGKGRKQRIPEKYSGIYLVKAKNRNGNIAVRKITF